MFCTGLTPQPVTEGMIAVSGHLQQRSSDGIIYDAGLWQADLVAVSRPQKQSAMLDICRPSEV